MQEIILAIVIINDKRSERYPAGAFCALQLDFRFDELTHGKGRILIHHRNPPSGTMRRQAPVGHPPQNTSVTSAISVQN